MKAASGSRLPALRFLHVISELNVDHFDAFFKLITREPAGSEPPPE